MPFEVQNVIDSKVRKSTAGERKKESALLKDPVSVYHLPQNHIGK